VDGRHDIFSDFVEPPKLLLLVGGDDDVLRNDIGLSYNFCCNQDDYTNAIQTCMEEAYSGACHSWHEFDSIHGSMFYSSHHSMEIPACIYLAFVLKYCNCKEYSNYY
jgi:hypothetical protein